MSTTDALSLVLNLARDRLVEMANFDNEDEENPSPEYKRANEAINVVEALTKQPAEDQALTDGDYTLSDGAAWFTVKTISIRIHSNDEGVSVDLYPRELETNASLASAYAFFSEAENEITAYAEENS